MMNDKYVRYLKDNPNRYWFRRKVFGWGWIPVRWPGFLVVVAYVLGLVSIFRKIDAGSHSASDTLYGVFVPFVLLTLVLICIGYWKGERPKWQWGLPEKYKKEDSDL